MEPKQDDIQIKQNDAILLSNIKQKSQVQKATPNFAPKQIAINNANYLPLPWFYHQEYHHSICTGIFLHFLPLIQ
jgi:flagellar biosynthesis protein FliQ